MRQRSAVATQKRGNVSPEMRSHRREPHGQREIVEQFETWNVALREILLVTATKAIKVKAPLKQSSPSGINSWFGRSISSPTPR
jgi:hypothetical protein